MTACRNELLNGIRLWADGWYAPTGVSVRRGPPRERVDRQARSRHVTCISRLSQYRHTPEAVRDHLTIHATEAAMTMSDDHKAEREHAAAQLTLAQIAERLRELTPVALDEPVVSVLQSARERR
jgi:hypothetical protein